MNNSQVGHWPTSRPNNLSPTSPQSSYNSSYSSSSGQKLLNGSNSSITVPGGVVTTQNISTVITPKGNNNSLQFVKIQTPELSKKAVEQIKIAEDSKITKDRIKEVEEEWQNNLLQWKSKRKQHFTHTQEREPNELYVADNGDPNSNRKVKTFAEMMEQRARSGNRLGFHLERYLGADDENESVFTKDNEESEEVASFCNDEQEIQKNRTDSDSEIQSSTSSGYNQPHSKSSSSPEIVYQNNSHDKPDVNVRSKFDDHSRYSIEANNNDTPLSEKEALSISLVDEPELGNLNSTLRDDLLPNDQRCFNKPHSLLELDTRTKEVSAKSEEDSDNSAFDDDDCEEEEQRRLQRIEFEAKLKVFERLAKPTPKAAPQSTFAQSPPIPPSIKHHQQPNSPSLNNKPAIAPRKDIKESTELAISTKFDMMPENELVLTQKNPAITNADQQFWNQPSNPLISTQYQNKPVIPQEETSSPTRKMNNDVIIHNMSKYNSSIPEITDFNRSNNSIAKQVNSSCSSTNITINNSPNPSTTTSYDSTDTHEKVMVPRNTVPNQSSKLSMTRDTANLEKSHHKQINENNIEHHHQHPSRKIPNTSNNNNNNGATSAHDNNRTVLSVSGKKRCSSCREELGRGAAAFVVESLSLVYHTNCFRCSVCHVNLSNGFRGVDVRVHAGALHCQNCYSKDGLNYSRV